MLIEWRIKNCSYKKITKAIRKGCLVEGTQLGLTHRSVFWSFPYKLHIMDALETELLQVGRGPGDRERGVGREEKENKK